MGAGVVTVNEVLDGHVRWTSSAWTASASTPRSPTCKPARRWWRSSPPTWATRFPSPALCNQIGQRFRRAVAAYAEANDIPWVQFDNDKLAVLRAHLDRQAATGPSGVAAIGVAQEFQRVWTATQAKTTTGTPRWSFYKADRRVSCHYCHLWDADFGTTFIKVCAWFPYPAKVWRNGHQWANRQATTAGIGFTEAVQRVRRLPGPAGAAGQLRPARPGTINVFVKRWLARLPLPLTGTDRDGGYWWGEVGPF